jgi:hypothetical protein
MAITTLDGYIGSSKQRVIWMKTGTRTLVGAMPYTVFDIAGSPGAGTLAIGNTANGVVPTDAVAGYPIIGSFSGGNGYISKVEFGSSVACCFDVYDRLFAAGAYGIASDTTLTSQPSFSGRIPNSLYTGLQLWIEGVAVSTGTPNVQINYLDQDGQAGDTGVIATVAALPVGRMFQMPLAAGDNGIQQITRVRVTVSTGTGTINVMILRPLWFGRVISANGGDVHDLLKTGFPRIYEDSALYTILYADSTAVGLPDICMQIAMG